MAGFLFYGKVVIFPETNLIIFVSQRWISLPLDLNYEGR
jgi:hypothetical protein